MTNEIIRPAAIPFDEEKLLRAVPFRLEKTAMLGVYTIPAPPAGFDHRTARPSQLIRAGLPWKRPDAETAPLARAAWDRAMARDWRREDSAEPLGSVRARRRPLGRVSDGPNVNSNWAGAVLTTGGWTAVIGTWTIPQIKQPPEPSVFDEGFQGWEMSSWVGLGGYFPNNSNNLLQVGVTQQLLTNGDWGCFAWYQWWIAGNSAGPGVPVYTYQAVQLPLSVNPGDVVSCSAQYVLGEDGQPVGGRLDFSDETTGVYASPMVLPVPSGANFSGGSAEWIVEAPDGGEWGTSGGPRSSLLSFTPVTFSFAVACDLASNPNSSSNAVGAVVQEITTAPAGGKVLTSTAVNSSGVTVTFTG